MSEDDPQKKPPALTLDTSGGPAQKPSLTALKLVVVGGPDEGREVPLDGPVDIGADPACALALTDGAVSRRHAQISSVAGRVTVKDLGSRNGTNIDGVRIKEATVAIGAVVTLGRTAIAVQPRWHRREVAPSAKRSFGELLGDSVSMREIFAVLERVSDADVPLLVEGDS